ncbi:MAG: hypothetical protein CML88_05355 [Rhodobiaceae bacterium]|nr:hypothetical protein [Rhodobiaceae bacterium]|tara:strand:- start:2270 stop:3418 length:1149 start_codon:yes stop_codon:yes gene_type:complete
MHKEMDKDPASIREFFINKGYTFCNPAMTIPADIVMNFMGEDVRNRLLFTSSPGGDELCLRPDFTLPLAISYINNELQSNKFVYDGYAFRFPSINEKTRYCPEFRQIGIENFGDKNKIDAEGDVISQAYEILSSFYDDHLEIKISDISMFYQLLDHLNIDTHLFNRFRRLYWRGLSATEIKDSIKKIINTRFDIKPRLDLIEEYKNNNLSSIAFIQKLAGSDDLSVFSGRQPDDIVKRYIDKSELSNNNAINDTVIEQITEFLSIKGNISKITQLLDNFQKKYHIDFAEGIENLENRIKILRKNQIPTDMIEFNATLSRKVEYYTGLVFEVRMRNKNKNEPIAIGGRYDKIFEQLGSKDPIPAVGCSIYVDRLLFDEGNNES